MSESFIKIITWPLRARADPAPIKLYEPSAHVIGIGRGGRSQYHQQNYPPTGPKSDGGTVSSVHVSSRLLGVGVVSA